MRNDDKWRKLQDIPIVRMTPVEKKLDNIKKVIADPDQYNVNIASRDRIEALEQRIVALEELLNVQKETIRKEEQPG